MNEIDHMKPELPLALDVPVQSYLDYSLPLSVVASHGGVPDIFYSWGVQMFFPDSMLTPGGRKGLHKFLLFPALNNWQWQALGFLEIECRTELRGQSPPKRELLRWLGGKMTEGWYPELRLNEYFLPGRPLFFGRAHNLHINMVTGIDEERDLVRIAGYGSKYCIDDISLEAFYSSFTSIAEDGRNFDENSYERVVWLWRPRRSSHDSGLRADLVMKQLEAYFASVSALGHRVIATDDQYAYPEDSGVWGVGIYRSWEEYLKTKARNRRPIDLRASRTLWEHKVCWMTRLRILAALKVSVAPDSIAEMQMVERTAKEFRISCFAYNKSGCMSPVDGLIELLRRIESRERAALGQVLDALHRFEDAGA